MVKPHRRSAVGSFLASHVGQFVKLLQCDAAAGPHVGQSTALSSCFVSLAALYVQTRVCGSSSECPCFLHNVRLSFFFPCLPV